MATLEQKFRRVARTIDRKGRAAVYTSSTAYPGSGVCVRPIFQVDAKNQREAVQLKKLLGGRINHDTSNGRDRWRWRLWGADVVSFLAWAKAEFKKQRDEVAVILQFGEALADDRQGRRMPLDVQTRRLEALEAFRALTRYQNNKGMVWD